MQPITLNEQEADFIIEDFEYELKNTPMLSKKAQLIMRSIIEKLTEAKQ